MRTSWVFGVVIAVLAGAVSCADEETRTAEETGTDEDWFVGTWEIDFARSETEPGQSLYGLDLRGWQAVSAYRLRIESGGAWAAETTGHFKMLMPSQLTFPSEPATRGGSWVRDGGGRVVLRHADRDEGGTSPEYTVFRREPDGLLLRLGPERLKLNYLFRRSE